MLVAMACWRPADGPERGQFVPVRQPNAVLLVLVARLQRVLEHLLATRRVG